MLIVLPNSSCITCLFFQVYFYPFHNHRRWATVNGIFMFLTLPHVSAISFLCCPVLFCSFLFWSGVCSVLLALLAGAPWSLTISMAYWFSSSIRRHFHLEPFTHLSCALNSSCFIVSHPIATAPRSLVGRFHFDYRTFLSLDIFTSLYYMYIKWRKRNIK